MSNQILKIMFLVLILSLFTKSTSFASNIYYNEIGTSKETLEEVTEKFVKKVSAHGEFRVWAEGDIGKVRNLYNDEGEISAFLITVENKSDIIGYILIEPKKLNIIEYSLGQSPYDSYLDSYISMSTYIKNKDDIVLQYDGPSRYGIRVDNDIIAFTQDETVNISINTREDVDKLMVEKKIEIYNDEVSINSLPTVFKVLNGVGDAHWLRACGPTAGSNIVVFWSNLGYTKLTAGKTIPQIIDQLYSDMRSIGQATLPIYYRDGLCTYLNRWYPNQFRTVSLTSNLTYNIVKAEIDDNRPGTILYWGHPNYGEHYVTLVGYQYEIDGSDKYYIIHDTHTNGRTYRLFDNDKVYISEYSSIKKR